MGRRGRVGGGDGGGFGDVAGVWASGDDEKAFDLEERRSSEWGVQ